jgi:hypothetical protein
MNDFSSNLADSDPTKIAGRLMQKAHNRDGLPEICAGLFLLWVAVLIYMQRNLPSRSMAFKLADVAFLLLTPVLCIGLPWAIKSLRRRFLLSRAGYVKSKPISRRPVYMGIAIAILALFFCAYVAPHEHWELGASAILWGAITAWVGRSLRFVVTAVVAVMAGLWMTLTNVPLDLGFAILWGGLGLISLISGTVVLLRFLRQSREDEESVSEEAAGV